MKPFALVARLLNSTLFSATVAAALVTGAASGAAVAADVKIVKGDVKKGEAAAQMCQSCHVADGSRGAPTFPILQGQIPQYVVKQLGDFKSGKRQNAIMNGMAAALTDEQMVDVAAFYASKKAKEGDAKDKDLVALGEKIYRGGVAETKVPACSGCHSPNGAGIPAQYPRLAGQHAEYIVAQLNAFRAATFNTAAGNAATPPRNNSAQMVGVAAHMTDKEIAAVADYIAGLR
ncbi:cytochrome c [Aquabacterium sp.]|uniref:c-type cytochrome n=1 Tax=Aquabacterium sp. TaxID=1872578 RepID=UPI0035B4092E